MGKTKDFNRFSSCRGVAFEIKPHSNPFAIPDPPANPTPSWLPVGSLSRNFQRSMNRTTSHFCDLDDDDERQHESEEEEKDENTLPDIEDGQLKLSPLPFLLHQESACSEKRQQQQNPKKINNNNNKPNTRLSVILLDQGLFTVYKRLFVVCIALNLTGVVLAATGNFPYARARPALFSIANVFMLVLCRSEAFLRLVFWLAVAILGHPWVPLRVKTAATSLLQSLGGVHSGCGVSSIAWLVYVLK